LDKHDACGIVRLALLEDFSRLLEEQMKCDDTLDDLAGRKRWQHAHVLEQLFGGHTVSISTDTHRLSRQLGDALSGGRRDRGGP
jgi:hypothetical protein